MPELRPFELKTLEAEKFIRDNDINKLPINPISVAENEGIDVRPMPPSTKGVSGMLLKSGDNFGIGYATHIENKGFQHFSIAHELGHYFLPGHIDHLLPIGSGRHESYAGFTSSDKYELEADYYAAGLLMPRPLFTKAMSNAGYGLDAVEYLSDKCVTSRTATAIRYAQLADIPTAIVISVGRKIEYAFMSEPLKEIKGLEWIKKGTFLPNGAQTETFNRDAKNITSGRRAEGTATLKEWLGGRWDIELVEEVLGLGSYAKTLTVLTIEDSFDEEELLDEEEIEESWKPRFR